MTARPRPSQSAVRQLRAAPVPGSGREIPGRPARRTLRHDLPALLRAFHLKLGIARLVSGMAPTFVGGCAIRARMYRWAGLRLGHDVAIVGKLSLNSDLPGFYDKLVVGPRSTIGHDVTINLDARVTLGQRVVISPHVKIYTANHAIGPGSGRMTSRLTAAPVTIEDGAWVRVGALVLPGVTVGRGSVVAAGAVVSKDVPPNTFVEGNPATVARRLPWGDR